jgi:hypothetical protein
VSFELSKADLNTFTPTDHLLGVVQRVVASQRNARISLLGKGHVVIIPERGEYYANVQDMPEFCSAPAAAYTTTEFRESLQSDSVGTARNINDLLWHASFHASQGRLIAGCSKSDIVHFRRWPNLPRLAVTPNTAQICALLTRKPTTIMLVHRILGINRAEVFQVYSAASSAGIANVICRNTASECGEDTNFQTKQRPEQGLLRSLFAKISGL